MQEDAPKNLTGKAQNASKRVSFFDTQKMPLKAQHDGNKSGSKEPDYPEELLDYLMIKDDPDRYYDGY